MTRSEPCFVPGGSAALSAVVTVPEGDIRGPAVLVLPRGRTQRIRDPFGKSVAERLARAGHPVMRLDHPGTGTSPACAPADRKGNAPYLQAGAWFREVCGVESLAVIGSCGTAATAVALAAADPAISDAVSIVLPIKKRAKKERKVRAGIAAIEPLGKRLTPVLARGGGDKDESEGWFRDMPQLLRKAAGARLTLIFGSEDAPYQDYLALLESGEVPEEFRKRWRVEVREGAELHGYTDPEDLSWLLDTVEANLLEAAPR